MEYITKNFTRKFYVSEESGLEKYRIKNCRLRVLSFEIQRENILFGEQNKGKNCLKNINIYLYVHTYLVCKINIIFLINHKIFFSEISAIIKKNTKATVII